VRFWDTSAIVPLLTEEQQTERTQQWLREDPGMVVWTLTVTEARSALHRKRRERSLSFEDLDQAEARLSALESIWAIVDLVEATKARAARLLAVHDLRAADALQLAAALVLTEEKPTGFPFLTFDRRLAHAAKAEGFDTL